MTIDESIDSYWVPIDPADLRQIAAKLRARDVFTPTFVAPEVDHYDPAVYRQQLERFGTPTQLLVDRNLVTRWIGLVRNEPPEEAHRLAAGVLAFAQCARIELEPNIALYEVAQRLGPIVASEELAAFRVADHVHPGHWAEIALGRANSIELPEVVPAFESDGRIDFDTRLRRWHRNYILALKLAELELEGGSSSARMSRLVKWMYDDFILGGPAIALAAIYLAPNTSRKGLLKGIRSLDRNKAIEGVRNAAWDLTLVSQWISEVEQQEPAGRLTLLASLDRTVHLIARSVVALREAADDDEEAVMSLLTELWGEQVGGPLAKDVANLYLSRDNPERQIHRPAPAEFIDGCIQRGESAVRRWGPAHSDA